jgi:hypothetical protein
LHVMAVQKRGLVVCAAAKWPTNAGSHQPSWVWMCVLSSNRRPLCVIMKCQKLLEYHDTAQCCSCYLGPWVVEVGWVEWKDVIHLVTPQLWLLLRGWAFRPFHHLWTWHQWAVLTPSHLPGQRPFIQGRR